MSEPQRPSTVTKANRKFTTFFVGGRYFGIDVMQVQEITKSLTITQVPRSPGYVRGLMNLRGQLATAIDLRHLFEISDQASDDPMNVVCRSEGVLLSFLVDNIGDVIEVDGETYEDTPDTVAETIRQFMSGVYKTNTELMSVVDVIKVMDFLNGKATR